MPYKVVDIYKDLPRRAGCAECGKPGCFAFATAVYLEGAELSRCPHLEEAQRGEMTAKLSEGREAGDGVRPEAVEQAAAHLIGKLREAEDLRLVAERAGARYREERDAVEVTLLGRAYLVSKDSFEALDEGDEPNVWVKVLVLIYLTRASGAELDGEWVAFRQLPSTVSKHKTYDKWVARIGEGFAGRPAELSAAVARCGGAPTEHDSADHAFLVPALPRVPVLLLVWEGDDDFGAETSALLDGRVLDYLDQESLVFLVETLMSRILGEADPTG